MKSQPRPTIEVCILAGGLSERMGRDKSRLRLGRRTMLGHVRAEAEKLGWPVRVIRRDAVPRCGALGGVYTALETTTARAVLFLACDMPLVTVALLRAVRRQLGPGDEAVFVQVERKPGFPFMIRRDSWPTVATQIRNGRFSLHELARTLKAKVFRPPPDLRKALHNVNTPEELAQAAELLASGKRARKYL